MMDRSRGEKVRLGYIGAVNDLKVHALPPVGNRLVTTIAVEQAVNERNPTFGIGPNAAESPSPSAG